MNYTLKNILMRILLFVSLMFLSCCRHACSPEMNNVKRGETFSSTYLGEVRYTIYIPSEYNEDLDKRFPVLYLLHGGWSNHETYVCRLELLSTMRALLDSGEIGSMIVVMPDGDTGWWIDRKDGIKPYESFLLEELIPFIDSNYRTLSDREHRAIGGFSMGGYGGFTLSFRHVDLFKAVAATSPTFPATVEEARTYPYFFGAFGDPFDDAYYLERDPITLAETALDIEDIEMYYDVGDEDEGALPACRSLHTKLTDRGITHEYREEPGGHNDDYFNQHIDDLLLFVWDAIQP